MTFIRPLQEEAFIGVAVCTVGNSCWALRRAAVCLFLVSFLAPVPGSLPLAAAGQTAGPAASTESAGQGRLAKELERNEPGTARASRPPPEVPQDLWDAFVAARRAIRTEDRAPVTRNHRNGRLVASRDGGVTVGPAVRREVTGNRLDVLRSPITACCINRAAGFEQGFTLHVPLEPAVRESLLAQPLDVRLTPERGQSGRSPRFPRLGGDPVYSFRDPRTVDAAGTSLSADVAVAGQTRETDGATADAVWPAVVDSLFFDEQKVTASDAAAGDKFGWSVAVDGDTALIGARYDDDGGTDSGAVYVFIRSGGTWSEHQKLTASDAVAGDAFGVWVALDGDTALISAPHADSDAGSAYLFTRSEGTWTEQQKLTASDAEEGDHFSSQIALDGDTALISAYRDNDAGFDSGSAYVFTRTAGTWSEQQKLTASDAAAGDWFGWSVALDGDTALIGSLYDDDTAINSGSAYVFSRSGGTWSEQQKLTASDADSGDRFGVSVAIDEDTALIGADLDDEAGYWSGSAYVFTRTAGAWTEQQKLIASDAAADSYFGWPVALDGDTALVSALNDDALGQDSGAVYVFTRWGGIWSEEQKLVASDATAYDWFGGSISLNGDTALIGGGGNDDHGTNSGAAYFFNFGTAVRIRGPYFAHTVPPCRVVDTRGADPLVSTFSGDKLAGGETVHFHVVGNAIDGQGGALDCGIPPEATSVFANIVAVSPAGTSDFGGLAVYAYGDGRPGAPTIHFQSDTLAVANGVLVPICDAVAATCDYDLTVSNAEGLHVHLVIDVTGYLTE